MKGVSAGTCRQAGWRQARLMDLIASTTRKYIYVGMTSDVDRRVKEHQSGKNKTTKPYQPFSLIHVESFPTRQEAREREKYFKSGIGKEWIKKTYARVLELVDRLA